MSRLIHVSDSLAPTHIARLAIVLALCLGALSACGTRRGPVEQAGHEIDDAAEDVEEEVDEATE